MKSTVRVFRAEILKLRRTKVFPVTVAVIVFVSVVLGFLAYVSMHPEAAAKAGLVGAKARLMDTADWTAYFGMLSMMAAAAGALLFGFAASWLFGREYADKTVKDLLALPVSRSSVVAAKLLVLVLWCLVLAVLEAAAGIAAGFAAGLPGWSQEVLAQGLRSFALTSVLELLLISPVAFFASAGRGYLLPLGFVILTLVLANFASTLGFGEVFPWAVPGLAAQGSGLSAGSYMALALASAAGLAGTFLWWRYADQK